MSFDFSAFLSRDELLGGLPARRASTLLFAIESRTAHLVVRSRRAMATYLTERTAAEQERAFLDALAQGREMPLQPSIQDLERYAPQWADLVPEDPAARAAIARMIGDKYVVPRRATPALRQALGLDDDPVRQAFERLHGKPLDTIYVDALPWQERLRWGRSRLAHRLETLPPFWTAFALTLTETVGAGILALPIAMASVGPIAGLVIILVLGLVNIVTIAAVAEAVARNGHVRYGQAFFGRLVRDYLGRPGLLILTPALTLFFAVVLLAYYVGLSTTLAAATGIPPEVWVALAFLAALFILRRETLDATVASALVVGAASIGLILLLTLFALPHVTAANLRHATVPFVNGAPFDASLLELVFGVVLLAYFGHTSAGNCAAVVLQRDPSARSFIRGSIAAIATSMAIYGIWVLVVNGAVPASSLAAESGTALAPLVATAGPGVALFGSIFAVLAMGMASIHVSLGLFNQVREWLPVSHAAESGRGWRNLAAHPWGRFVAGVAPVVLVFLVVEALLLADSESFAGPLAFLGVITSSVIGGIFPMLMVVASRRKGDYALPGVWRAIGHPAVATIVSSIFVAGLLVHGLVLWNAPYQRAAALLVAAAVVAIAVSAIRQGAFRPRAVVEVRVEEPATREPAIVNVVAAGEPVAADIRWPDAGGRAHAGFCAVEIALPPLPTTELRVWAHHIDPTGQASALPALLEIDGDGQIDLRSTGGQIVLPCTGATKSLRVTRADPEAAKCPSLFAKGDIPPLVEGGLGEQGWGEGRSAVGV